MKFSSATFKRTLISGASVVTIAAVTGLIGLWGSAYGQGQPAAGQPSTASVPSFVGMTAPLSSGFPGVPTHPCYNAGGMCYHNALEYSDLDPVLSWVSEGPDGTGETVQNYNYFLTGTKEWVLNNPNDLVGFWYDTGTTDEYGNRIMEAASAYASGVYNLAEGKNLDLNSAMASSTGGRITNLADGVNPMDAVNKRQLDWAMQNAGGNDPLAVKYTDGNRNTVSVGGRVANISDGVAGNDAVNVNQLNGVRNVAQDGVNRAVNAQARADQGVADAGVALQVGAEGRDLARRAQATADTARSEAGTAQFTADKGVSEAKAANDLAVQSGRMAVAAQATADGIARYVVATPGAAGDVAANAGPEGAVALGYGTTAGSNHVAVGQGAVSMEAAEPGSRGAAVGYNARARGNATAIGGEAAADDFAVAVGRSAEADLRGSAFGANSYAVTDGVALGNGSRALEANTVSVGNAEVKRRIVNVADGVAASDAVTMKQHGELTGEVIQIRDSALRYTGAAFSARRDGYATRISGVADATDANDAVNKRQLDALAGQVGVIGGDALQFDGTTYNAVRNGQATRISGVADGEAAGDAVNRGQLDGVEGQARTAQRTADQVGVDLAALDARAVQFTGPNGAIAAKGARVVDLADGVDATDAVNKRQLDAVAGDVANVGRDALLFDGQAYNARRSGQATRITGVADGVEDSDAVNRGQLNTVRNDLQALDQVAVKYTDKSRTAISLGDGSRAVRMSNVAAGVTATDAVNKGQLDAVAADLGAVASDALMYDGQAYNATRGGQATRITGVAAGTNRTDATNFGQLDAVASIFGAGGRWANGSYVAPTFVIGGQTFTTVGDAFAAVDGRLAGIEDRVTDVEERPTSTRGVTYDDESRDAVTLEGKSGTRVSNVADGKADTDAANVRQVKKAESNSKAYTDTKTTETLQTAKRYTDTRVNDVSRGLDELGNRMERGFRETNKRISRQSAMTSAMVQMGINAAGGRSERGRIAFGLGYSDGEAAVSVGYGKSFGRGSVSVGGAFSGGEASVGVGFGFDM